MYDIEASEIYLLHKVNQRITQNTCTALMLLEHVLRFVLADEGYRHCISFRNCGAGGGNYRARSGLGGQRLQWPSISRLGERLDHSVLRSSLVWSPSSFQYSSTLSLGPGLYSECTGVCRDLTRTILQDLAIRPCLVAGIEVSIESLSHPRFLSCTSVRFHLKLCQALYCGVKLLTREDRKVCISQESIA